MEVMKLNLNHRCDYLHCNNFACIKYKWIKKKDNEIFKTNYYCLTHLKMIEANNYDFENLERDGIIEKLG